MPARKIVDEQEVLRWVEEGRPYWWMSQQYREKYSIETVPTLWSNFRRRRGLPARQHHDENLMPWRVKEAHQFHYLLRMLRCEARVRRGQDLRPKDVVGHRNFLALLAEESAVVAYDPDTAEGFRVVPREEGDDDLIRRPRAGPHYQPRRQMTAKT